MFIVIQTKHPRLGMHWHQTDWERLVRHALHADDLDNYDRLDYDHQNGERVDRFPNKPFLSLTYSWTWNQLPPFKKDELFFKKKVLFILYLANKVIILFFLKSNRVFPLTVIRTFVRFTRLKSRDVNILLFFKVLI